GLGLLIARELLTRGYPTTICARDAAELERARDQLAPSGEVATAVLDVADRDAVVVLVHRVDAKRRLDVVSTRSSPGSARLPRCRCCRWTPTLR
ncbi:SDR family NAD(P)-dependent oxidoreductase, partial [Klebsiella pneumoniae]|nr:SDR family NAD(P)-dependent oxidoreductase [Klebsiella pneumoniae]